MAERPNIQMETTVEQLLEGFVTILHRSRERFANLDRGELNAHFLSILSMAVGNAVAILMLPERTGDILRLEVASGPLPCPAESLFLRLSPEHRSQLTQHPNQLESIQEFQEMARKSLKRKDVFARALVQDRSINGAFLLIPPKNRSFTQEEKARLQFLANQINTMQTGADIFSKLINYAMVDDLTGLFNYRYFRKRLPSEIARATRHGHHLSILFCEIDEFPILQNKCGHRVANQLLMDFASLLRPGNQSTIGSFSFRISDITFRYGGAEFIAVLPETPRKGAVIKAEQLRQAVEAYPFYKRDSMPQEKVTISIGVATCPDDASDAISILDRADQALHRAKEKGYNRVETYR